MLWQNGGSLVVKLVSGEATHLCLSLMATDLRTPISGKVKLTFSQWSTPSSKTVEASGSAVSL